MTHLRSLVAGITTAILLAFSATAAHAGAGFAAQNLQLGNTDTANRAISGDIVKVHRRWRGRSWRRFHRRGGVRGRYFRRHRFYPRYYGYGLRFRPRYGYYQYGGFGHPGFRRW